MFEMFHYDFMLRGLAVSLVLAFATAAIGQIIVLRRLSQLGDALSHSSLAGVAVGLIFGFNPVLGALGATIAAAFTIEVLRRFFPRYSEISIAVVFSLGIGLAGVLSGFSPMGNFASFLFGSIVAISDFEMYLVIGISISVVILISFFSRAYCHMTFDEEAAALSGVRTGLLNTLFTLMTAVTISIASRSVGALVVSSLLVIPVACAMQLAGSYRKTRILTTIFSVVFSAFGLWISFICNFKPGGTIVLLSVVGLFFCFLAKEIRRRLGVRRGEIKGTEI